MVRALLLLCCACGAPRAEPRPAGDAVAPEQVAQLTRVFERGGAFYWMVEGECRRFDVANDRLVHEFVESEGGCTRHLSIEFGFRPGLGRIGPGPEPLGVTIRGPYSRELSREGACSGGGEADFGCSAALPFAPGSGRAVRAGPYLWFVDEAECRAARDPSEARDERPRPPLGCVP